MKYITIIWDHTQGGNVEHIAEHGLTPNEVEDVLLDENSSFSRSDSTGRPVAFGLTSTGRYIMVAFDEVDDLTVYPVTAYDVREPEV